MIQSSLQVLIRHAKVTVIQAYASTNVSTDVEKLSA